MRDPVTELKEYEESLRGRIPGRLLFLKVAGSHSHNVATDTSDVDFLGVYEANLSDILSTRPPPESIVTEKPDGTIYEMGKFAKLLLVGNPNILEMAYTDRMYSPAPGHWSENQEWESVRRDRDKFLSQTAVKQYLGYAQGQIQRLQKGSSVHSKGGVAGEKWAYHIYRLVMNARRMVKGDQPKVWFEEGSPEHTVMRDIRSGLVDTRWVAEFAQGVIREIEESQPWALPKEGSRSWLDGWLYDTRVPHDG